MTVKGTKMLLKLAVDAMKNAYVPYSKFPVGVAILSAKNKFYFGCNVENAAYPQGLCAEAGAISSMVSGGCMVISEVLVVSKGTQLIVPCGGCRQKLLEFSKSETRIHLATQTEIKKTLSMDELLPFSFDKTYLNI